jgi:hypothetical protein
MRRFTTVGLLAGALMAGGVATAPASFANATMPPTMTLVGVVPGDIFTGYTYPLSAPAPGGVAPGMTIRITGAAMTGATGDYAVSQELVYGYVPDNTRCSGSGTNRETVPAASPVAQTYRLPTSINGVAPQTGGYFCAQRFASGLGTVNQGVTYRSDPYFIPIGVASNAVANPPLIVPPGGRDYVQPSETFPLIFPLASGPGGLQPGESVVSRGFEFGNARTVGGTCTLDGSQGLQANAQAQRYNFSTGLQSGYLCVRQTVQTNFLPPRKYSAYRYIKVQRPVSVETNPDNPQAPNVTIVEVRPNLPELTTPDGSQSEGRVGEAYRLTATVSGSVVNNNLLERSVYTGYSSNNTSCANATRNEQANANTQPIVEEGTFEAGREGQFFCTFQSVNVAGTVHYSNVLYQEIVAAGAAPAPTGPVVGVPPTAGTGNNAPPTFDNTTPPAEAGAVADGKTAGPRLLVGDIVELQSPATAATAGDATVRLRTKASAKRGGKTRVRVTVQPTNSAGTVDFYLTTPRKSARVIGALGSVDVNSSGVAAQRVTVPKTGTKKGKRYYLVAEYTSPQGDVTQVVRKIRLR